MQHFGYHYIIYSFLRQRLGGRKHDNLCTGGGNGVPLPAPPSRSRPSPHGVRRGTGSSEGDALLIDLSPPPRSPSLATSGSDGVSVNSLSSESSGNFFEAPSSWASNNGWTSTGTNKTSSSNSINSVTSGGAAFGSSGDSTVGGNFDPFESIVEESSKTNTTWFTNSDSTDHSISNRGTSVRESARNYSASIFRCPTDSGIDWEAAKSYSSSSRSSSSPPDPFSPVRSSAPAPLVARQLQQLQTQQSSQTSTNPVPQNNKSRSGFRATIIRPKQPQQQQQHSLDDSSRSYSSQLNSISFPAPVSSESFNQRNNSPEGSKHQEPLQHTDDAPAAHERHANDRLITNCGRADRTYAVAEYDYDSSEPGDLCLKVSNLKL